MFVPCAQVTGENYLPPPPPPVPEPPPPGTPPPFGVNLTLNEPFLGCQQLCDADALLCRDGGKGSFSPPLCDYSTQCGQCGVRERVESVTELQEGDDSCEWNNDGFCQDGRASTPELRSYFVTVAEGQVTHLCGRGTDKTDCGPFTVSTLTNAAFGTAPQTPFPHPPPPSPNSPPPSPPTLRACVPLGTPGACSFTKFCSDGGVNSHPTGHDPATGAASFACELGTQCDDALCRPRIVSETVVCSDSCGKDIVQGNILWTGESRNGICEDGGDPTAYRNEGFESTQIFEVDGVFYSYEHKGGCGFGKCTSNSVPFMFSLCTDLFPVVFVQKKERIAQTVARASWASTASSRSARARLRFLALHLRLFRPRRRWISFGDTPGTRSTTNKRVTGTCPIPILTTRTSIGPDSRATIVGTARAKRARGTGFTIRRMRPRSGPKSRTTKRANGRAMPSAGVAGAS